MVRMLCQVTRLVLSCKTRGRLPGSEALAARTSPKLFVWLDKSGSSSGSGCEETEEDDVVGVMLKMLKEDQPPSLSSTITTTNATMQTPHPAVYEHYIRPYLATILDYVERSLSSVVLTVLIVSIVVPVLLFILLYSSAIWLHIFRLRHRISQAFHRDPWEGARSALASFWDAHGRIWHGYQVDGLENIPSSGAALIVYYHGTLPVDVYYLLAKCILFKQRVLHCVGDKFLFKIPGFRLLMEVFNVTPGSVDGCVEELNKGNILCIGPGGVREALFSSDKYDLVWGDRKGFAKIAITARAPIIPMFTQNIGDAFRTPSIGRSLFRRIYEMTRLPLVPIYGGFPVKLRTILGKPLPFPNYSAVVEEGSGAFNMDFSESTSQLRSNGDLMAVHGSSEDDELRDISSSNLITPEELRDICAEAIENMIDEHQNLPGSIIRGILDRFRSGAKSTSDSAAPNGELVPGTDQPQNSIVLPLLPSSNHPEHQPLLLNDQLSTDDETEFNGTPFHHSLQT